MATVTYIRESKQSISAMKGVIDYCCQDKKVYDEISNQRLVSGINCDGGNAFSEFLATKKSYQKTDGMNFYQYVQSFSPEENITPQKAHEVALEFAEKAWSEYGVLVATHCDAQHIHSHFVINSVSFQNGKKLRQNPNTLKSLRALSDEICRHHNLSTLEPYSNDGMKISTREYRTAVKGQSLKFKLMNDIDKAMNISGNKEDFINAMSIMGYSVIWTDDRKYITYQCPNKMKCRDIKLHNDKYLKGSMEMNSDTGKNNILESLKQRNSNSLTAIELLSGETKVISIPSQVREEELTLLRTAITFQPELYNMISKISTDDQMVKYLERILEINKDNMKTISQNCQTELKKVSEQTLKEIKSTQTHMTKILEQAGKSQEEFLNNTLQKGQELESAIASQLKRSTLMTTLKWIALTVLSSAVSTLLLNHFFG